MAATATLAGDRNCTIRSLPGVPVGWPRAIRKLAKKSTTTPTLIAKLAISCGAMAVRRDRPASWGGARAPRRAPGPRRACRLTRWAVARRLP